MKTVFRSLATAALLALPGLALAQTPQLGVEQKIRRGFYTETDLGTYFDVRTAAPFTVSNAQAYLQLGLGYDLTERLSIGLQFGLGASSGVCLADVARDGTCGVTDGNGNVVSRPDATGQPVKQVVPDNFSNTFFQGQVTYAFPLSQRLRLAPRVIVGYQKLDPAPVFDASSKALGGGFMAGADVGLEYATHMDHFTVGLEVEPRYVFGPNLLSMAIFPRVKYTF